MKIQVRLISTSALKLSEYRTLAKTWKPDPRLLKIFRKLSGGQSDYRLYVSPKHGKIKIKTVVPKEISTYVKQKGFHLDQIGYVRGYAVDKYGRQVKLGKILSGTDHLQIFASDVNRKSDLLQLDRDSYVMVISHHAYDILGASTDRSWTSCTNLRVKDDKEETSDLSEEELLEYRKDQKELSHSRIKPEVDNRSIIAYIVRKDDKNIEKPIARALGKLFKSVAGSKRYIVDALYPNMDLNFYKNFQNWLDTNINPVLKNVENDFTEFKLGDTQYNDFHYLKVNNPNRLATSEELPNIFIHSFKYGVLPSEENIHNFIMKLGISDVKKLLPKDGKWLVQLLAELARMTRVGWKGQGGVSLKQRKKYIEFICTVMKLIYKDKYPFEFGVFMNYCGHEVRHLTDFDFKNQTLTIAAIRLLQLMNQDESSSHLNLYEKIKNKGEILNILISGKGKKRRELFNWLFLDFMSSAHLDWFKYIDAKSVLSMMLDEDELFENIDISELSDHVGCAFSLLMVQDDSNDPYVIPEKVESLLDILEATSELIADRKSLIKQINHNYLVHVYEHYIDKGSKRELKKLEQTLVKYKHYDKARRQMPRLR